VSLGIDITSDMTVSLFVLSYSLLVIRLCFLFYLFIYLFFFFILCAAMMSLARGRTIYDPSEGSVENILTTTATAYIDYFDIPT